MDEDSPHLHLVFVPVVHTKDSKGNDIRKISCSEFWKGRDSYRQLQNAFYSYVTKHGFKLERGLPKEETNRKHYSVKEFKQITNFEKTKELLESMTLELPKVPELKNMKKVMIGRDDKILNEIIKPKDKLIKELYRDNLALHKELSKQANVIEKAEKYENERDKIISNNRELHNQVDNIKLEYKEKEFDLEWKYKSKIKSLEKENIHLHKVVDKFKETIGKFITWICKKFDMGAEDNLIKDFEKDTRICLDAEKQLKRENREKEFEMEL